MSRGDEEITFLRNLLSGTLFKRNQGRLVRRLTAIAIAVVALYGCWTLSIWLETSPLTADVSPVVQTIITTVLALGGLWLAFRTVNYPRFANFLISVEAEMDKVSWADIDYLKRATAVVLCTMLFLGVVLAVYDLLWLEFFSLIKILDTEALKGTGPPGS